MIESTRLACLHLPIMPFFLEQAGSVHSTHFSFILSTITQFVLIVLTVTLHNKPPARPDTHCFMYYYIRLLFSHTLMDQLYDEAT